MRHRPNLRYTECGRPHFWQRVYARTLNFGFRFALLTSAVLAMSVLLEGEAELLEQRATLVIVGRRGDHGDVHAPLAIDPVLVDLVEHRLLGQAERVVAVPVELAPVQTAEVPDTRERDRQQPVQELPHPVAAQGHLRADRHALAELELRDRLGRPPHLRLLTRDRGQVAHRAVDQLGVAGGLAHTHVDDDLHQAGNLHRVRVLELLLELPDHLGAVALLEAGQGLGGRGHHRSLPVRREMRTFWPLSSVRYPTRVGLPSESTTITFEMWIMASCVTMPPVFAPRWVVRMRSCFLTRFTPSTRTLSRRGKAAMT